MTSDKTEKETKKNLIKFLFLILNLNGLPNDVINVTINFKSMIYGMESFDIKSKQK